MKIPCILIASLFVMSSIADDHSRCYQLTECLAVAGIKSYNTNTWPLDICNGDLLACFVKARTTCGEKIEPFIIYMHSACSCSKSLLVCEPQLKKMLKKPTNIYDFPSQICSNLESVSKCLDKSTVQFNCPENIKQKYRKLVNNIKKNCANKGCIDSYGKCAEKSFEMIKKASEKISLDDLGYKSLKSFCSNVDSVKSCFKNDEGKTKCSKEVIAAWQNGIKSLEMSCSLIGCYKEVSTCAGPFVVDVDLKKPMKFDIKNVEIYYKKTLSNFCGENRETFKKCMKSQLVVHACPAKIIKSYKESEPTYDKICKELVCRQEINTCSKKFTDNFIVEIRNGELSLINPDLKLICKNIDGLKNCFDKQTPHCEGKSRIFLNKMELVKQFCKSKCLPDIEDCSKVILKNMFTVGNVFLTELQCNNNPEINSCFEELKKCDETKSISVYKQLTCKVIVCTNAMDRCSSYMTDGLRNVKFSRKGLVKICNNIKSTVTCLKVHDNEKCIDYVMKLFKIENISNKVIQSCKRMDNVIHPKIPLETEKEFITMSLRLNLKWSLDLYDMTTRKSVEMKNNIELMLNGLFKNEKDFIKVIVVKFYEGSIGVLYSVQYNHNLKRQEVLIKAEKLAALTSVKKFTIGDESVEVLGSPSVILKDRTVVINGLNCELMTLLKTCGNNGKCAINNGKRECSCEKGFTGKVCEKIASSATSLILSTAVLSITILVISMFA